MTMTTSANVYAMSKPVKRDPMDEAPPPLLAPPSKANTTAKAVTTWTTNAKSLPSTVRTPKIDILAQSSDTLRFALTMPEAKDDDESLANGLRITIQRDVPTFAIDRVCVEINTTVYFDNQIEERLSLIPLWSDQIDRHPFPVDCQCGLAGCDKCILKITLNVKHDTSSLVKHISTEDLVMPDNSDLLPVDVKKWRARKAQPLSASSPSLHLDDWTKPSLLFKLGHNQQLKLVAYVRKGAGGMHGKWRPTLVAAYIPMARIDLESKTVAQLSDHQRQLFVESCPMRIFKTGANKRISIENADTCTHCLKCMQKAESFGLPELVTVVEKKPQSFLFSVQSKGGLDPKDIVQRASTLLSERLSSQSEAVRQWSAANPTLATPMVQAAPTGATVKVARRPHLPISAS